MVMVEALTVVTLAYVFGGLTVDILLMKAMRLVPLMLVFSVLFNMVVLVPFVRLLI